MLPLMRSAPGGGVSVLLFFGPAGRPVSLDRWDVRHRLGRGRCRHRIADPRKDPEKERHSEERGNLQDEEGGVVEEGCVYQDSKDAAGQDASANSPVVCQGAASPQVENIRLSSSATTMTLIHRPAG